MALLSFLAVTNQSHSREALATLFWPDYKPQQSSAYLRHAIWTLRKTLGLEWIEADRQQVGLRSGGELRVDVTELRDLLAQCEAHGHSGHVACAACVSPLSQAVALYRGDFLQGFTLRDSPEFDDWQRFQGEQLRQAVIKALERLVQYLGSQGDLEPAIRFARRWVQLDPLHEPAYQQLIWLYASLGNRAAALQQYQECVHILKRELGVAPTEETTALAQLVKDGRTPSPRGLMPTTARPIAAAPRPGPAAPSPLSTAAASMESRTTPPHNLPVQLTPFVGREEELALIGNRLADAACRLLTITGPGGIGKTRLAIQAAASRIEQFRDGVFFVPLAPVMTVDFLVYTIANALNFSFYGWEEEPLAQLLSYLRDKEMLLVMDNFEHLLAGVGIVTQILESAPAVKILATSRERLNLQGEWVVEIAGLKFPEQERGNGIEHYSAVQLFLQGVRRVQAGFTLTASDKPAVARICRLVEGMPLALELASSWARVLSCQEIAREIEHNLSFLTTSWRDVPDRHRSLRAVFQHSWKLLNAEQRVVFRKLAVFRGGFEREAAQKITGASLDLLLSLVEKSLLQRSATGRYHMHELLRQFAEEKLTQVPEEQEQSRAAHCRFYVRFLQEREQRLQGREQREAVQEITAEIENVRVAWYWAVKQGKADELDRALQSLLNYYEIQGWFQEGERMFADATEALRQQSGEVVDTTRIAILGKLSARQGGFSYRLGHYSRAQELFEESLSLFRRLNLREELPYCLNSLADIARIQGAYAKARALLQESIALCEQTGDKRSLARALNHLGIVLGSQGKYQEAQRTFEQSLAVFRQLQDRWGIAKTLNNLGIIAYFLKDYTRARQLYGDSLAIHEDLGNQYGTALTLNNLGLIAHELGEYEEAHSLHCKSLEVHRKIGYSLGIALALNDLGLSALAMDRLEEAREHFGQALQTAMQIQAMPVCLSVLVSIATLLAREGQAERAVEIVEAVRAHPAANPEVKDRALTLLAELESALPATAITASRRRATQARVEELIRELLPDQEDCQPSRS